MDFFIAVLLCLGDNCDLVRAEPTVSYPTYELCSQATVSKSADLGRFAAAHKVAGRESEMLCVRQLDAVVELDEEREALVATDVREQPSGSARVIATVPRGNKVHVNGAIDNWLRVSLPTGKDGYIIGERTRKLSFDEINRASQLASAASAAPERPAARVPAPPESAPPPVPPPQATAAQGVAGTSKEFRDCAQCPVMIRVAGGSFDMGSAADPSEKPVHRVVVAPFALGKFEVSQGEWSACAAASSEAAPKPGTGPGCAKLPITNEQLPMLNLSWDDAARFVDWLSKTTGKPYRLPSEAEWEYAARAGTTTSYPWGQEIGVDKADCVGCGTRGYTPQLPAIVGTYSANSWGFFDMFGGVAEWVADCWHKDYAGAPSTGAPWQSQRCVAHVLRGGSWKNPAKDVTVSVRNYYDTSVQYVSNGLRVAMALN
jgi:formylglycine-generating enzyme required for sulfatase activity